MGRSNKKHTVPKEKDKLEGESSSGTCPILQVLLLGEANFSFALALRSMLEPPSLASMPCDKAEEKARDELYHERLRLVAEYFGLPPQPSRQWRITATCYERYVELVEKYPESDGILSRLWNFAVDVSPLLSFVFWEFESHSIFLIYIVLV